MPLLCGSMMLVLFLQACSTYSPSRGYPSGGYSYQPQISYYGRGYSNPSYYGSYQPGWFITGYPGAYSGAWVYAPLAYRPSYFRNYYRNAYYPYYDPWYYSHFSPYQNGYGYGYVPGYRYGSPYGFGYRPYYGNVHSYRPPGQHQQPPQNQQPPESRPEPVVIPPSERGRRGVPDGYNPRIGDGLRPRGPDQADRRSVQVVNEEQDLSRSVGVAPTQAGDQGMSISSRSERKVRSSRLEPSEFPSIDRPTGEIPADQNSKRRSYSTKPVERPVQAIPVNPARNARANESPPETARAATITTAPQTRAANRQPASSAVIPPPRSEPVQRQAPARQEQPGVQARQQQPTQRNQPAYQQRLDSSNVSPRADRRQARDPERQR